MRKRRPAVHETILQDAAGSTVLVGRGRAKPRSDNRTNSDLHQRSEEADSSKRARGHAAVSGAPASETKCGSIITWNIDGLRAFLRDRQRVEALNNLLASSPALLCLLEHKLQANETQSDAARAELDALAANHK